MISVDYGLVARTIEKYGEGKQLIVGIEELSELQKEICKALRGKADRDHIVEEFGDVLIMLSNIKQIYNISDDEIISVIQTKQQRTIDRML